MEMFAGEILPGFLSLFLRADLKYLGFHWKIELELVALHIYEFSLFGKYKNYVFPTIYLKDGFQSQLSLITACGVTFVHLEPKGKFCRGNFHSGFSECFIGPV